jgi:ABC-type multidrug transport system fused ATPase/permease subunit
MIARAVCGKRRILMLDEATSALDNVTQRNVVDSLAKLKCTRIVIAHRLSTVKHCDRILVLQGGAVTGFDTHENLLRTNQLYQEIYEIQTSDRGDFDGKMRD